MRLFFHCEETCFFVTLDSKRRSARKKLAISKRFVGTNLAISKGPLEPTWRSVAITNRCQRGYPGTKWRSAEKVAITSQVSDLLLQCGSGLYFSKNRGEKSPRGYLEGGFTIGWYVGPALPADELEKQHQSVSMKKHWVLALLDTLLLTTDIV